MHGSKVLVKNLYLWQLCHHVFGNSNEIVLLLENVLFEKYKLYKGCRFSSSAAPAESAFVAVGTEPVESSAAQLHSTEPNSRLIFFLMLG